MDEASRPTVIGALRLLAYFAGVLMLVGLIIGFVHPGPVTELLLPIGVALWWLAGSLGRRYDSSAGA
jgi:hypothetical protein